VAVSALLLTSLACGASRAAEPPRLSPEQIYQRTVRGVALILTQKSKGTGWLLDRQLGLVVTNAHVVGNHSAVFVRFPEFDGDRPIVDFKYYLPKAGSVPAERVLAADAERDLALLRLRQVPPQAVALKLSSQPIQRGDRVWFVGNPADRVWDQNDGTVVEVLRGRLRVATPNFNEPGASGSPTLNAHGEVVGVLHARLVYASEESHSIDLEELLAFLAESGLTRRSLEMAKPPMDPKMVRAEQLNQAGQQRHFDGAYAEAITHYTAAIEIRPDFATAWRNRGITRAALKEYDQAIADYSQAIRLNAQDAEAWYFRGLAQSASKNFDQAISDYQSAIQLGLRDPGILRALAFACNERGVRQSFAGRDEQALADYTSAIAADSRFSRAYRNRGAVYLRQGKLSEAVADFTQAIANDPDYVRAYRERADALARLGRHSEAERDRQEADRREQKLKASGSWR
jgi:tetratricopeptide (TPR) repeat protein